MRLFQDEGGLIAFAPSLIARPLNEAMLPSWGTGGLLFLQLIRQWVEPGQASPRMARCRKLCVGPLAHNLPWLVDLTALLSKVAATGDRCLRITRRCAGNR